MEIAAANIDRVMNLEMRRRGLPRGKKWPMYLMAQDLVSEPLCLAAGRLLDRAPSRILILTGAAVPDHMPVGENDGPIGSSVLTKALVTLGHKVTIVSDPECIAPIEGLLAYLGTEATLVPIGLDDKPLQDELVESNDVFVAIERLGGNLNGHLHGVNGVRRDHHRANLDHIVDRARGEGKPTLGIGDGGNEIGFGNLYERLSVELAEHAFKEATPCGGGVFSVVKTDLLLVANSSNIGAYGTVAGLALLTERPDLCHTGKLDEELHLIGVGLGLVDGANGAARPWCDGIPPNANSAVVEIMRNIVQRTLEPEHLRKW